MSLTFFVAGRRSLPTSNREPWSFDLSIEDEDEDEDEGIEMHEMEIDLWLADRVGFRPVSAVAVSPVWQASEAVASELARALEGAVFCEATQTVTFDARGAAVPCATLSELEARLASAFERECTAWRAAEGAAEAETARRFAELAATDPEGVARGNDWSDVSSERAPQTQRQPGATRQVENEPRRRGR